VIGAGYGETSLRHAFKRLINDSAFSSLQIQQYDQKIGLVLNSNNTSNDISIYCISVGSNIIII
jgi:hypothetical protein